MPAGSVDLTSFAPLRYGPAVESPVPPTFEELGLEHGLVRYTFRIPGPRPELPLTVEGLRDRATLWVDGERVAEPARGVAQEPPLVPGGVTVELLVESLGRVNYGPMVGETKGITGGVRHEQQYLHGCRAEPVRLDDLTGLEYHPQRPAAQPCFARGVLTLDCGGDTYLAVPGGRHGHLWVNGFHLGRYDDRGPQRSLYCPEPVLRRGGNEIVLLELGAASPSAVELRTSPDLG